MSKYDGIEVGDYVDTLGACGANMYSFKKGYICKVIGKNIDGTPKPNILIENANGKQARIHSQCGEQYFNKR